MEKSDGAKVIIIPQDMCDEIARLKGHAPKKAEPVLLSEVLPISTALRRAEEEALKGQTISGKGIFAGVWNPQDRDGKSLGLMFNLFAAPQDLTDEKGAKVLLTFNNAVKRVSELKNWHGHDGGNYGSDAALYNALKDGSYNGQWFIPTFDILRGKLFDAGREIQPDNLFRRRETGDFKGTFTLQSPGSNASIYWSCTEYRQKELWSASFENGADALGLKNNHTFSTRPVRAELKR